VPESKTNAFSYSLYPHAGNWAAGAPTAPGSSSTTRSSRSSSRSTAARCREGHGVPDGRARGLGCDRREAAGNPTASFSSKPAEAAQGLTVRLYEAEGKQAKGVVRLAAESAMRGARTCLKRIRKIAGRERRAARGCDSVLDRNLHADAGLEIADEK